MDNYSRSTAKGKEKVISDQVLDDINQDYMSDKEVVKFLSQERGRLQNNTIEASNPFRSTERGESSTIQVQRGSVDIDQEGLLQQVQQPPMEVVTEIVAIETRQISTVQAQQPPTNVVMEPTQISRLQVQVQPSRRSMGQLRRQERERLERASNPQSPHPPTRNVRQRTTRGRGTSQSNVHVVDGGHAIGHSPFQLQGRHYLGKMNIVCSYCQALHWIDEKLANSSLRNPKFGICCTQGKIRLPLLREPPSVLKALFDGNDELSKSFREHIRQYNAANAFTSLGCRMDPRVLNGRGPYSFVIHGELRHRTGALLPEPDMDPMYSQLYIYDASSAFDNRIRRNPTLNRRVLMIIQEMLLQVNAFVPHYRQAHEILSEINTMEQTIPAYLHYSSNKDRRRYNEPTTEEIALILPGDGTEISGSRDIIIQFKGNTRLMQISECHPAYLPLHYVLLFPFGELGWSDDLDHWNVKTNSPILNKRVTMMEYYCYRIFQRLTEYSTILRGGKLFQEFLVDAWAATEQNRLRYIRIKNAKFRVSEYSDLVEIDDQQRANQMGQQFILPSSFMGGPRQMYEVFQDSMAITRHYKHPDIFLTMTANPSWPHQSPSDHPVIVARVFELKRKALMKTIMEDKVFGEVVAYVLTIEFQKRGLPHMHALFFLGPSDKIRTAEQVDKLISAEFPPDDDILLLDTIKRCMVHGPCGERNTKAQCLENGKCTKKYPRSFEEHTSLDQDGYPIYRRRNDGRVFSVSGKRVNNQDVVPHNPYLARMFDCHINVEVCAGLRCVKYIHKYIYKGHDRTTMVLGKGDEIKQYLDARYIGPPEAARRLLGHVLHEEKPNVVRLCLHLKGKQRIVHHEMQPNWALRQRAESKQSKLMAFFDRCALDESARVLTYQQFPQHYTWQDTGDFWQPRKEISNAIGRIYFSSPKSGERFYLRLLLINVKGPTSFENLRTFNNIQHDTFKEACIARGLLEDDGEWVQCLEEAAIMKTGYQLRRLFGIILIHCCPTNPHELWVRFSMSICDDLPHQIQTKFGIPNPSDAQVTDYGLYLLNQILEESGKTLRDFPPMPLSTKNWAMHIGNNRLIAEHIQLQFDARTINAHDNVHCLNNEQLQAYEAVTSSVIENKGLLFFLNGGAGTGKTFLYNTIAGKCRSLGHFVICVASSGIASLLLVGGRTAHSTFCLPLDVFDNTVCSFTKQSIQADLFRKVKLIIWDEVPMQHRHCVEAVDRTLQDICDNNQPFGGITVVLGGDFRQTLPVIPQGFREQVVCATLKKSPLWKKIIVFNLISNMRLNMSDPTDVDFARYLIEVGTSPSETITLPPSMNKYYDLIKLIHAVYPGLNVSNTVSPAFLTERTILAARNDDVNEINAEALNIFPGEVITYLSADKNSEDDSNDPIMANRYPIEYLNSLNPPGLPPSKLELKIGCPVILLRNLAPKIGLCNGTRLMVVQCAPRIIEAQILTGDKAGNNVLIPRISLSPTSSELTIPMMRRQFPIRLAYAMTINKSQGQSVNIVGIDLRIPVFTHGQLYVALSRCTSFRRISVLLPRNGCDTTSNIVYPEVLQDT